MCGADVNRLLPPTRAIVVDAPASGSIAEPAYTHAPMSDLESKTRYDPSEVEPRIVEKWLQSGLFHPELGGTAEENYSIAIPPPNVTGVLHMGHALNNAVQDCLIRTHRMRGQRTKWILGTDHAGIATQTQVERALEQEGLSREQIGREAFVERVWRWREQYGGAIIEQLKRLGASCDYETERFTLDEGYVKAVLEVFTALYDKGYIYRDRYMVNWDPGMRSAISDLEVEEREVTDTLYYIDYPLASGSGSLTVATVRPETMLADTAIAVHPDDERYRRLIGETAILPLVGRKLKIIADDYVKPEFGTGALKITPGHDPNDFDIGHRHGLALITVIGEDGRITEEAPERFVGLPIREARDAVLAELREQGLIAGTQEIQHPVPFSHRSGERIEPLVSLQWFMRMDELAAPAIEVVRSRKVKIHPESEERRYLAWLENIRPWCISRQLWWGHQIPVWYRGNDTYVGTSPPDGEGWERDPDVLDTWFSSALWPFATLGWPEDTPELRAFYPTSVLSTARDIIFLWVARMVMMGLEFTGEVPFSDVYVHSIIQAPDGRRMSKSLGTGIDPIDLINGGPRPPAVFPEGGNFPAYGADAVRWGLLAMSSGQDVKFAEDKIAQGQQLTNKLWNASRLILLRIDPDVRAAVSPRTVEDRWILSRLERAKTDVSTMIERFDFSHAALALYDFVYGELCDWYLELVKPRLYAGERDAAQTLLHVLIETLALAHPIIPFVTEEIYSYVPGAEGLLAAGIQAPAAPIDEAAEASLRRTIEAVQLLRGWRDFAGVKAGAQITARLAAEGYDETAVHLERLARLSFSEDGGEPIATVAVPGGSVEILPSDGLDLGEAERKTEARRAELETEIARAEKKLANQGFVAKAPAEVVQTERDKLARLRADLEALR
jgi:valyl-tRNA synthetase